MHIEPLLENSNEPLRQESANSESGPGFMLDQLNYTVVLASQRLVLSCLLLERKHLEQLGRCRPKTDRSFPKSRSGRFLGP